MSDTLEHSRQESDFDTRLLLAGLHLVVHIIDTDGPEAAAWYDDNMDVRAIIAALLSDEETRVERLARLVCTLKQI